MIYIASETMTLLMSQTCALMSSSLAAQAFVMISPFAPFGYKLVVAFRLFAKSYSAAFAFLFRLYIFKRLPRPSVETGAG